jgi:hypothetical protein
MFPYFQSISKYGVSSSDNPVPIQNLELVLIEERRAKPTLEPKSFESNIQGLQFIQPGLYSNPLNVYKQ